MVPLMTILCLIEVYLRIFNPQPIRPAVYQNDPLYGLKMVPGLKGYLREEEFVYPFRLNSLGFRDEERSVRKSDNVYRIIGLGDSFSWGAGVGADATFLKKLEERLNQNSPAKHYEVFNWGVNAWGTAQQLLCLKYQAIKYNPDLIILQYFKGNDLSDNVISGLFVLDATGKLKYSGYDWKEITLIKKLINWLPLYRFITQHSHLANFIRIKLLARLAVKRIKEVSNFATDGSTLIEYKLRLTEAILDDLFSFINKNRIKVALIVFSERGEIEESSVSEAAERERLFKEGEKLIEISRRYNVPLLDFKDIFIKEKKRSIIYYKKDEHLTPYGHTIVVDALEKFLKDNSLI